MKKFTYEEVKSYFDKNNLTLISKTYENCKIPLQFVCNNHSDKGVQNITFDRVKNSSVHICKYCATEYIASKNRVDMERIKIACNTLDFEYLGTYIKDEKTYVKYICNKHKDKGVQEKAWGSFKRLIENHRGCPYCSKMKRTSKDFDTDIKQMHPNIEIADNQFKNRNSRIKCKCRICDYEWETSAGSLLAGHGCWRCYVNKSINKSKKDTSDYEAELYAIHPNIVLRSSYNGAKNKIKCQCLECNNVWETTPYSILTLKYGCPKCAREKAKFNQRQTQEEFESKLRAVSPYVVAISEYVSRNDKIQFCCTIHNEYYYQLPYDALNGKCGCFKCQDKSNGEKAVSNFLRENSISFIAQYRFDNCRNKRRLPFDFYLPDYNTCIEYDGELHYKSVEYFGGEKALQETQRRDNIKTQYCKENNIKLIRIPYWDFDNINTILSTELNLTNNI